MQDFVIGNMAWNAILVTVAGCLIRMWMTKIESNIRDNRKDAKENEDRLGNKVDLIYTELRLANSRTSKIEAKVQVQKALCDERTKHGLIPCTEQINSLEE